MSPHDPLLPLWAMELVANVFLWVWLFCMGATVGSFLNVVVYRLPRGLNLAYPGSFCPHCGHAIRLQDNIPLLSWLNLRGRCRDCGGAISPRYFFVELVVAVAFIVVLTAEYYLPAGAMGFRTRYVPHVRDGMPFWCMYFMHVALVTTLIGAILLRADQRAVPATLFLPVIVVGLVLPLVWPEMRSVPAWGTLELRGWQAGLVDGSAGMAGGLFVALVLVPLARRKDWRAAAVLGFCFSIAVVLGWQRALYAIPVIFGISMSATFVVRHFSRPTESSDANGTQSQTESTGETPVPPERINLP